MSAVNSMPYWEAFLFVNLRNQIEASDMQPEKKRRILELLKRIDEIYGEKP